MTNKQCMVAMQATGEHILVGEVSSDVDLQEIMSAMSEASKFSFTQYTHLASNPRQVLVDTFKTSALSEKEL